MEGFLESCLGYKCPSSCCSRGYGEPIEEFMESYRWKNKDRLKELGINFEIRGNLVWFDGCSDGINCKILEYMGEGDDERSLICKIFPYVHNIVTEGDKKNIAIHLRPCPATRPGYSVPKEFTDHVLGLVKKYYSEKSSKNLDVVVTDSHQEA